VFAGTALVVALVVFALPYGVEPLPLYTTEQIFSVDRRGLGICWKKPTRPGVQRFIHIYFFDRGLRRSRPSSVV
jgi:hypothetical protein